MASSIYLTMPCDGLCYILSRTRLEDKENHLLKSSHLLDVCPFLYVPITRYNYFPAATASTSRYYYAVDFCISDE